MLQADLAALTSDAALLVASEGSLGDARSRLDAMLVGFPASSFVDSAAYFDGRAHYELVSKFGAGSYADAELLFERSYAANASGTWSDNALYYDGRCEFEEGYALVAAGTASLTLADYDRSRLLFDRSIGAQSSLLSRFTASSYRDNASYFLGRAWLEKPTPDVAPGAPAGTSDAERVANLGKAITALTAVVNTAASSYAAGARYWRGRAHYNLWFHQAGTVVDTELDLALGDFHAVPASSTWRDNALYYAVKSSIHEANPVAACTDFADLLANFTISTYTTRAAASLAAAVPPIACP
jgi:outer membrane protein assembly factor BamD (BamD/ComL family)